MNADILQINRRIFSIEERLRRIEDLLEDLRYRMDNPEDDN